MKDFYIEKKIYYHDTDCGGVVYYANYLKFIEESRSEYCLSRGVSLKEWSDKGLLFPVVHAEITYKAPARYQDTIRIFSKLEKIGNTSVNFSHEIRRGDTLLIQSQVVWVCVGKDFKPHAIPEEIRTKLSSA